jgi:predicted metal-dependent peptidase
VESEAFTKVTKARIYMILNAPFFGSLSMYLSLEERNDIPTFATDGKSIKYNPELVLKMSHQELVFALAHETMHAALTHPWRVKNYIEPHRYNIAGDCVINEMLIKNGLGQPPDWVVTKDKISWRQGLEPKRDILKYSADEIYHMISDESDSSTGKMGEPGPSGDFPTKTCGGIIPANGDDEDSGDDWKQRIESAVRAQGSVPAGLEEIIEELHHPKKDWREILIEYIVNDTWDYSIIPPNRVTAGWGQGDLLSDVFRHPVVLESVNEEKHVRDIVYCVDTSGSMSNDDLRDALSEGVEIGKLSVRSWLMYCDSKVQGVHELTDGIPPMPKGRGGTSFIPPFEEVAKRVESGEMNTPTLLIYFTDGDGPFPSNVPDYPVCWVINTDVVPPWGMLVRYEPSKR